MTEATVLKKKQEQTLSAAQVADYLMQHPQFFLENEALLADLHLPGFNGAAISLVDRQAKVMRERNSELRHRLAQLMNVARDNEQIFKLIRKLGLALLEAESLSMVTRAVNDSLLNEFRADRAHLFLYDAATANDDFVTVLPAQQVHRHLGALLHNGTASCGALRRDELNFLFPGYVVQEGSAALIPLHFKRDIGLLAIGNYDPAHFSPSMDTLFVSYMGDAIARRLATFLQAPV